MSNHLRLLGISSFFAAVCSLGLVVSYARAETGTELGTDARASLALSQEVKNYPQPLVASNRSKSFFDQGEVGDVFGKQVQISAQPELELIRPKSSSSEQAADETIPEAQTVSQTSDRRVRPTSAMDVVKQYGDPSEDFPVLAQKEAVGPLKGMYAALALGDKKLATRYAFQYAKYQAELQRSSKLVGDLMGAAAGEDWANAEHNPEAAALIGQVKAEQASAAKLDLEDVEPELNAFPTLRLERSQRGAFDLLTGTPETRGQIVSLSRAEVAPRTLAEDSAEKQERSVVRVGLTKQLNGKVSGTVNVFWFFNPNEDNAFAMASEVEKLSRIWASSGKVMVTGLSTEFIQQGQLEYFQRKYKITFPLRSGEALVKSIGLSKETQTLFVPGGSDLGYVAAGLKRFGSLDETMLVLTGTKAARSS